MKVQVLVPLLQFTFIQPRRWSHHLGADIVLADICYRVRQIPNALGFRRRTSFRLRDTMARVLRSFVGFSQSRDVESLTKSGGMRFGGIERLTCDLKGRRYLSTAYGFTPATRCPESEKTACASCDS